MKNSQIIHFLFKTILTLTIGYCLQANAADGGGGGGGDGGGGGGKSAGEKPSATAHKSSAAKRKRTPPSTAAAAAAPQSDEEASDEEANVKISAANASSDPASIFIKHRVHPIRQQGVWGCAEAAVQMVLGFHKVHYHPLPNIEEIRNAGIEPEMIEGFMGHYDLHIKDIEGAETLGLTLDKLLTRYGPLIFLRKLKTEAGLHAVVMTGIVKGDVIYNDPAELRQQSMKLALFKNEHPILLYYKASSEDDGVSSPKDNTVKKPKPNPHKKKSPAAAADSDDDETASPKATAAAKPKPHAHKTKSAAAAPVDSDDDTIMSGGEGKAAAAAAAAGGGTHAAKSPAIHHAPKQKPKPPAAAAAAAASPAGGGPAPAHPPAPAAPPASATTSG